MSEDYEDISKNYQPKVSSSFANKPNDLQGPKINKDALN